MVSTFSPNKRIELPAFNDYVNSWNIPVNADWSILDLALGGAISVNLTGLSGNQTLTSAQYQPLKIIASGAPTANTNLVVPAGVGGLWVVRNNTTGGFAITISSAAGGSVITVPVGTNTLVTCDGTAAGMFLAINTSPVAAGTDSQVQFNNAGVLGGAATLTWNGTTLTTNGLNVTGSAALGAAAGDTLAINGTAVSAPNGLNVNTNQLRLGASPYNQVMINAAAPYGSSALTVGGVITSTAGGYYFPDGTNQTTAAAPRAPAGTIIEGYWDTAPPGYVMLDGKTIGSAASGASARANTDCLNLYSILWNYTGLAIYTSAGVLTTRGASAALDFAAPANKRLALPDHSGRVMAARDNLSGTARGILNGYTGPGITGGEQTHQLTLAESASHGHVVGDHTHVGAGAPPSVFAFFNAGVIVSDLVTPATGTGNWLGYLPANTTGIQSNPLTTDARGSDGAHNNIQPTIAVNVAIAL